jgi:hypothetical protein
VHATDWTVRDSKSVRGKRLYLLHIRPDQHCGPKKASSAMGKGALSEGKVAGLGVDHSIPSTAEVTNDYSFTSIYPYPL